ncbi:hypothetical protein BS50DRAFT_659704 [Corynespora cassiicola Philippines]|uniref:Uncharacterized protein n=1 Tax=Corynespora cassiicola Philippines TaxID=1448308 RepID=A0A2T2NZN6_CORCC|nr:hypothetical protein BS50DRAFT_659704 [Corynespora cassiicola Philippines]
MSFEFATTMPAQRFPPVDLAHRAQSKYLEDYEILHDILVYATCAVQRYGLCSILYNHLMSVIKNGINEWKNESRSANAILHDLLEKERDIINDYNKGSLSSELSTMHHTDPIAELWTSIPTPRVIPDIDQSFPIRVASVTMGMGITELTALDQIDLPDDANVFPDVASTEGRLPAEPLVVNSSNVSRSGRHTNSSATVKPNRNKSNNKSTLGKSIDPKDGKSKGTDTVVASTGTSSRNKAAKKASAKKTKANKAPANGATLPVLVNQSEKTCRVPNAPSANVPFPKGNVTMAELLAFGPNWIKSHDVIERAISNGASMVLIAYMINYYRDTTIGGPVDSNWISTKMRYAVSFRKQEPRYSNWKVANHKAPSDWDPTKLDTSDFRTPNTTHETKPDPEPRSIPFKGLAKGLKSMPKGDDALDLTRCVQYHTIHPNEKWMFPEQYQDLLTHIGGPSEIKESHQDGKVFDRWDSKRKGKVHNGNPNPSRRAVQPSSIVRTSTNGGNQRGTKRKAADPPPQTSGLSTEDLIARREERVKRLRHEATAEPANRSDSKDKLAIATASPKRRSARVQQNASQAKQASTNVENDIEMTEIHHHEGPQK